MTQCLVDIATGLETCLDEPAPSAVVSGFGASSVDFQLRAYAKNDDYWGMVNELRLRIFETLNKEDIEIPFSQIVVHQAQAA